MTAKKSRVALNYAFAMLFTLGLVGRSSSLAEVKFEKKTTVFGGHKLTLEIADTDEKRERGLMNRSSMAEASGMIFIFKDEEPLSFWMKNTLIPLSIGYFDKNGKLFQVLDMDPASPVELSPKLYVSIKPAKYALEMNKGWFKKNSVMVGSKLDLRSLKETK